MRNWSVRMNTRAIVNCVTFTLLTYLTCYIILPFKKRYDRYGVALKSAC